MNIIHKCHICNKPLNLNNMIISCKCQICYPVFLINIKGNITYYSIYKLNFENQLYYFSSSKQLNATRIISNGKVIFDIPKYYPITLNENIYEQVLSILNKLNKLMVFK